MIPMQATEPHGSPSSSPTTIVRNYRAMGCAVELLACTEAPLTTLEGIVDEAVVLLAGLEARWSRFLPDSELSRLNRSGSLEGASPETFDLVAEAILAWQMTDALFDPTVHDALVDAGYDRTFDEVIRANPSALPLAAPSPDDDPRCPAPGPVGIELDPDSRSIRLPEGVHLDLGGIGKGRAVDLVADLLRRRGVAHLCVNLGGDVRVAGLDPSGEPWCVGVEDPFDAGTDTTVLVVSDGAVATSARTRRTWTRHGRPAHHLIDPATGRPAARGVASVTVVAAAAQWAEVLAKAAFVAGPDRGLELIHSSGAAGLLVTDHGQVRRTPGLAAFEVDRDTPTDPQTDPTVSTVEGQD